MRIIYTLLIIIAAVQLKAQDAIVTQKFNNPLFVNPALTGNGDKTNRLTFLYRDQWRSVVVPYSTTYLGYDRKMMVKNNNQISAGLQFFYDRAGGGALTTFNPTISMAYTKFLMQERIALSSGLQIGYLQTSVDATDIQFNNQFGSNGYDPNISSGESFENGSFVTFGLGLNLNAKIYGNSNIDIGFAAHNPHKPTYDFSAYLGDERPARYSAYFNSELFAASQWSLSPAFYFNAQEKAREYHTSLRLNYYTKSETLPIKLSIGGGYRNNDAILTYVGAKVKDIQVGFSYDINTSEFTDATNKKGGFELSLTYEFEKRKKKVIEIDTTEVIDTLVVLDTVTIEEVIEDTLEVIEEEVVEIEEETVEIEEIVEQPTAEETITAVVNSLPLKLYFDNNEPKPNTNSNYISNYNSYISRQNIYAEEIGADKANEWFETVTNAKIQLDKVVDELELLISQGYSVKLTLKGFASPLASKAYNEQLAKRRIESVLTYLKFAKGGALAQAFNDNHLSVVQAPIGESTSSSNINDQLSDKKQSIFGSKASSERRVEIIAVDIFKK